MPNWKKVVTSGSDATLNSIYVAGSITASNVLFDDISVSGNIYGEMGTVIQAETFQGLGFGGAFQGTGWIGSGAQLSGSFTGSFKGDGSELDGILPAGLISSSAQIADDISGSAIIQSYTNFTDDRIITSVDSKTINAEPNLTFDGNVLAVNGSITNKSTTAATQLTGSFSGSFSGIYSGTYTPTITNVSNIDSSTAHLMQYMRINNVVTVSGMITVDSTSTGALTTFTVTLPIASNFSNEYECSGAGSEKGTSTQSGCTVYGNITSDTCEVLYRAATNTSTTVYITFTYLIK